MYSQVNVYSQKETMNGLSGEAYIDPAQPWLGTYSTPDTSSSGSTPWWQTALNVIKTAVPTVSSIVKTNQISTPTTSSYAQPNNSNLPPSPSPVMSIGAKIAIGVGAAAAIGGGVYLAFRKKKK